MKALRNTVLAAAWLVAQGGALAQADLTPGSRPMGAGNLFGGMPLSSDPGSFYREHSFYLRWQDDAIAPGDRFSDISGYVGNVWRSSSGDTPYLFSGVELYSGGGLLARYGPGPSSGRLDFTFSRLLEGSYTLRFVGSSVAPPPGEFWLVNQWQYAFGAVASPAPEPSQWALAALGLAAVGWWSRRARRGTAARR